MVKLSIENKKKLNSTLTAYKVREREVNRLKKKNGILFDKLSQK